MMKKLFILAMGLFLQGSGFCAPAPLSPPDTPSVAPASPPSNSGCKIAYVEGFSLQPPATRTISLDKNAWAFLDDKKFLSLQRIGFISACKFRFISLFFEEIRRAQSTYLFFKCLFDEKKSFAVDLTFLGGICTRATIYGSWPTPPPQILEFVRKSVLQKGQVHFGTGIFIVAAAVGIAAFAAIIRSNNRDEVARIKHNHSSWCYNNYCRGRDDPRTFGNVACDGYGEMDRSLWPQKKQEREIRFKAQHELAKAQQEQARIQRAQAEIQRAQAEAARKAQERGRRLALAPKHANCATKGTCYTFGNDKCDGYGEMDIELWPQRQGEREAARRFKHSQECTTGECKKYGHVVCDGFGELDKHLWVEREQERLEAAKRERAEKEHAEKERLDNIRKNQTEVLAEQRRRRTENAQQVSVFAQKLKARFADNAGVSIDCSKDIAQLNDIPRFAYDLANSDIAPTEATSVRVVVIAVSDLAVPGLIPALLRKTYYLHQILIQNAQKFIDRGFKIIIVDDLDPTNEVYKLRRSVFTAFSRLGKNDCVRSIGLDEIDVDDDALRNFVVPPAEQA